MLLENVEQVTGSNLRVSNNEGEDAFNYQPDKKYQQ